MNFRRIYNRLSRTYDMRHTSPTTLGIRKKEIPLVRKFASGRVLDVGCGTGFHLPLLKNVTGMDISEGMLRLVKSEKPILQASAETVPFKDRSFDSVLCMFSVLNACNHTRAVKEMQRVLRPGGRTIVSVASIWDWDYDSLDDKKKVKLTKEMKNKRFRISGEDVELYLFSKDELVDLFEDSGFSLELFDSLFILQKPRWGDLTRFSFREKMRLRLERFYPKEYGCIYFMVFRKS
jgi:SAM-dependent methyltransferase